MSRIEGFGFSSEWDVVAFIRAGCSLRLLGSRLRLKRRIELPSPVVFNGNLAIVLYEHRQPNILPVGVAVPLFFALAMVDFHLNSLSSV